MKQKLGIVLFSCLLMCLLVTSTALADDEASDYLTGYSAQLTSSGDGKMLVEFIVLGTGVMTEIGVKEIRIDKKVGNDWVYDRTLYAKDYSNFIKKNALNNSSEVSFSGSVGTQYKATITAYAANTKGSDSKPAESNAAICR